MIRYKEGEVGFEYNNKPYTIHFRGSWLLDGPVGHERWLEEYLYWNCYNQDGIEVDDNSDNLKLLIEAENKLTNEIWSVIV